MSADNFSTLTMNKASAWVYDDELPDPGSFVRLKVYDGARYGVAYSALTKGWHHDHIGKPYREGAIQGPDVIMLMDEAVTFIVLARRESGYSYYQRQTMKHLYLLSPSGSSFWVEAAAAI